MSPILATLRPCDLASLQFTLREGVFVIVYTETKNPTAMHTRYR